MQPRIKLLDKKLANQIAAGEVIERPASVVKELLENSLDAGANKIQIDIEKGGVGLIRVRDNGRGILKEDLALALTAHATSKIHSSQDLQNIQSLGFRGEALASIGSISNFLLQSKAATEQHAWQVSSVEKDMQATVTPASHPTGTTVEVRDLFFNVPARRKFLRSEKTEFLHIEDLVKKIAISEFSVAFTLTYNRRPILQVPALDNITQAEKRIASICGKSFSQKNIFVDFQVVGLRLWGWIGLPDIARSQSDLQYFYVNKRIVRDRLINHAIRQACEDVIYPGKHCCYILYLEIDAVSVDVNVHPTKHEVRFRESRLVHDFILYHLKEAWQGKTNKSDCLSLVGTSKKEYQIQDQMAAYQTLNESTKDKQNPTKKTEYKIISVIDNRYVIQEKNNKLQFIDLQRVCQHIIFFSLMDNKPCVAQPLLMPESFVISEKDKHQLEQASDFFQHYGINISLLSSNKALLRELPSYFKYIDKSALFACLLSMIKNDKFMQNKDNINKLLAKLPLQPDRHWKNDEIVQLLHQLDHIDWRTAQKHFGFPCRDMSPQFMDALF